MWRFASLVLCFVAVTSGAFAPDYAAYHNLSSAYRRVGALADAFPGFVRVDHSFKSRNGLSQLLVRLSNFSDSSHAVGPRVQSFKVKALLSYGESARELLPVESILHFLRRVLRGLGAPKDSAEEAFSRALFSKVDLYIVVLLNPDGRNHVERTGDHCWKGTGTGANLGTAFGLDVDRSLREPECNILLNLTKTQAFDAFISFHSGRREIHLPLTGFRSKKAGSSPANMEAMAVLAGAMAESVQPHLARDERTNRAARFSVEGTAFNFMAAVRKVTQNAAPYAVKWVVAAGKRLLSNEEAMEAVNSYFGDLEERHFREGIEKVEKRWTKFRSLSPFISGEMAVTLDQTASLTSTRLAARCRKRWRAFIPLYQKMFLLLIAWKAKQMSLAFNSEHDSPSSTMYLLMLAAAVVVTLLFVCQHRFPNPMRLNPRRRVISLKSLSSSLHNVSRVFSRDLPSFVLRGGVLFRKNFGTSETPWLLVVPASLREEIFQACHDDPTAGHLGYSRTLARIRDKYYWPKLPKTIHLYTRSCHECQRRKKPPSKPAGLLQPITPPTKPFQQIGMDLLGPFPPSTMGNRWIIVATDYLTRYAETKALPSGTAVEVAKFFIESIVLRHGAPEVLITDRGSSFMAQLTQEILRLSHTEHRRTTAYHPQTNGLTERLNKTIADMVSMYVDVEHKTWDEVLPYVTFAYNTAVQETTGVTPFQLVYGRAVTTMLDSMLPHESVDDGSDDAQVVAQRAEEVRQLARLRIQDQQHVDAGRYNLRRRDVHFQPGDRVWVWTPMRRRGLSEKLLKRYFGPYKVLRRLGDLNYEVLPDGTRPSRRRQPRPEVVHVVRLKPYYER
ncbi:uncharacterized protein ISCGN_028848 [Ixodes scapularis]